MPDSHPNVHVVIVTYGSRRNLLDQVLASLTSDDAITGIHLVSNNAAYELPIHPKIMPILLDTNTGSANGYKVGILSAVNAGAGYIWLLDDDNQPRPDALSVLLSTYEQLNADHNPCFALVSQRPGHEITFRQTTKPTSFLGFKLSELGIKIARRLFPVPQTRTQLEKTIPVSSCPYGGLFFAPQLIDTIGLPNEAFVLYGDDTEFTSRITSKQGELHLVAYSIVDDLEASFNVADKNQSSLANWLVSDSDMRAYYSARNLAYWEQQNANNNVSFRLNRFTYILILAVYAVLLGKISRFQLLLSAFRHADAGKLGFDDRFPLA